jgi:Holliday junction resolvase
MSTPYKRGCAFEYAVKKDMEKRGYFALRSPAAQTPADIYCFIKGGLAFIQCKTSGRLDPDEWNELFTLCESVNATPVLAKRGANGRGIEYYKLTGIKEKRKKAPMEPWEPRLIGEE